ncbi:MAG: hypothetical protein WCX46_04205 [Candidatus Paceibacterota bacterium]
MEFILKHLDGDEQYRFLDILLQGVFRPGNKESVFDKRDKVIREIMNEVNEK